MSTSGCTLNCVPVDLLTIKSKMFEKRNQKTGNHSSIRFLRAMQGDTDNNFLNHPIYAAGYIVPDVVPYSLLLRVSSLFLSHLA